MGYEIRTVRAEDWAELRVLRLAALADPAARVASVDSYEMSSAQSDDFWRVRATPIAEGGAATNVIASDEHGTWVAMLALPTRRAFRRRRLLSPGGPVRTGPVGSRRCMW